MKVLVIGGAGYIGSHLRLLLDHHGIECVILDNLSSGRRELVAGAQFVEGAMDDVELLSSLFRSHGVTDVMHFAAFIEVGESVRDPAKYYRNNVRATLQLLDCMVAHNLKNLIFSSTAAIFGPPRYIPIDENHPKQPASPYARSKLMVEEVLEDYDRAYGVKSICLRYFNAAGADPSGRTGECHDPETHLIPLTLQVASGRKESITIYGNDYETPDGTCIRDYVHVQDLCQAHVLALRRLRERGESDRFNLGSGRGASVHEVIKTCEEVTGRSIATRQGQRRDGDTPVLVADSTRAKELLGWNPKREDLGTIVRDAWHWETQGIRRRSNAGA